MAALILICAVISLLPGCDDEGVINTRETSPVASISPELRAALLKGLAESSPKCRTETYFEKVPYEEVETYYEQEPYQATETYYVERLVSYEIVESHLGQKTISYEAVLSPEWKPYAKNFEETVPVAYVTIKNTDVVTGIFIVECQFEEQFDPQTGDTGSRMVIVKPGETAVADCAYSGSKSVISFDIEVTPGPNEFFSGVFGTVEVPKERDVTKYRDVEKQRTVTKYQEVEKQRTICE